MIHSKTCKICGKVFESNRSNAKMCSDECRDRNSILTGIKPTTVYSRRMRKNPTAAEAYFREYLLKHYFSHNTKCTLRNQKVIGGYIADFVIEDRHERGKPTPLNEVRLIVEIDGGYHGSKEQQDKDRERTHVLNTLGYDVLRFTNEQVLSDMKSVQSSIYDYVNAVKSKD